MWIVFLQKDKPLSACDTAEADCIRLFWICRSKNSTDSFFSPQWIQYPGWFYMIQPVNKGMKQCFWLCKREETEKNLGFNPPPG